MLQFIATKSDKYSISEEVQMAIEGGCRWVQLSSADTDLGGMRQTIEEIKPMCEENEAFLTVENDLEAAKETKIHGIHITRPDISPITAREELGPHAIIGVNAASANEILKLKNQDIDYVAVGPFGTEFSIENYKELVREVRAEQFDIHIVAYGNIPPEQVLPLLSTGISGIALSNSVIDSPDPVVTVSQYLNILQP